MTCRSIVGALVVLASWGFAATASANYPYYTPNFGVTQCWTCHNNASGGGGCASPPCLTQFGVDFAANGHTWSYSLAIKDSDGDGFTNGRELMDYYGQWDMGDAAPGNSSYVTYPGHTTSAMSECSIGTVSVDGWTYNYNLCAANASCGETNFANPGYTCTCPGGYTASGSPSGSICNDNNECSPSNPCGVGTCQNLPGSFTCNCPTGYAFNGTTCAQDACARNVDNCFGGTTCNPVAGDANNWSCTCAAGYQNATFGCQIYVWTGSGFACGYYGWSCSNYDECTNNNPVCPSTSACVDTTGSYSCTACGSNAHVAGAVNAESCVCNTGFSGDPYAGCADVDECLTGSNDCAVGTSTCHNTIGSFTCTCFDGYSGNGKTCTDVDECATNADDCATNAACVNDPPGTYQCLCDAGYLGDGRVCRDVDECATDSGGCGVGEACVNTAGGHHCECAPGYVSDGVGGCVGGCGNGAVLPPEQCDDANVTAGDGCSANCKIEPNHACSEGVTGTSVCVATCGNSLIQPPGENCDEGANNSDSERNACRTSCRRAYCGDGVVDDAETCDEGAANSSTIVDACRTNCLPAYCGDGVVDTEESCDPGGSEPLDAASCSATACAEAEPDGHEGSGCSCSMAASDAPGSMGAMMAAAVLLAITTLRRRTRR